MEEVYIVAAKRTPLGSFGGKLAAVSATKLGSYAIEGILQESRVSSEEIDEVLMGNVLSAGLGQAPARQAALGAKISEKVPATTINKVCASGLKAVMIGAQSIALAEHQIVVAGGMENMSQVPYYLPKARFGHTYGHGKCIDGLMHDGLWEVYNEFPMGNCAEVIAKDMNLSRDAQDAYAIESYQRAAEATQAGFFKKEICPILLPQKKGDPLEMYEDEEYTRVHVDKIPKLKPVFDKEGTVTAANASTLNDGAAALLLVSGQEAERRNLQPIAKILSYADAAQAPVYFTTSPALAAKRALQRAHLSIEQVDYFEINEAFAVVALANQQLLKISSEKLNVYGGAVALGHPLGCSGARILVTLCNVLREKKGKIGLASICNGGGGASAVVVEKV